MNVFRAGRLAREVDGEIEAHIEAAIDAGRDPDEARRAFGSALRVREASRDVRTAAWLDSFRADLRFSVRQLAKRRVTSLAAVLSLGLAIGACTSAFRLIDALLLRPLPVSHPEELYTLARQGVDFDGRIDTYDAWAYPAFERMRAAVKDDAELIALANATSSDVTYGPGAQTEKVRLQYVSGSTFASFGLRPALGRLLTPDDDAGLREHPYAVISADYWTRRFGRDPSVVGRTLRTDSDVFEIVGVIAPPFTGTETGTAIDVFVPAAMSPKVLRSDQTWIRIMARIRPGVAPEPLRARLHAVSYAFEAERARSFAGMSQAAIAQFLAQTLVLVPSATGASFLQHDYGRSLVALGALVALVLLIACANVANLMTAQGASRRREMALRVSIGAGRWRLVQLVLVEGAIVALVSAAAGAVFAWWSAPFVLARIDVPGHPVQLALPADWRVLLFTASLTVGVALFCSLIPAARAVAVAPADALKGGADPPSRLRVMHGLVAAQAAFCFFVLFAGGLFVVTFSRLSARPVGFTPEGLVTLDTIAQQPQPPEAWQQVLEHVRSLAGVQRAALASWGLLSPANSRNGFISVNGEPPGPVLAYFLSISPGWLDTMKVRLVEGRDFRPEETSPGVAMVNEAFAKMFFGAANPLGRSFANRSDRYTIVGVVGDVPYRNLREPVQPTAYFPFRDLDANGRLVPRSFAALIVRAEESDLDAVMPELRREAVRTRPGFRVSGILTQTAIDAAQTVRERLLATLALFFTAVALLLAGIGLYGVLEYSVIQRRREIGIRVALGARLVDVARRIAGPVLVMVLLGAGVGLALGLASAHYVEALFYEVKPTDPMALAWPAVALLGVSVLAALPPVIHSAALDPAATLRAE